MSGLDNRDACALAVEFTPAELVGLLAALVRAQLTDPGGESQQHDWPQLERRLAEIWAAWRQKYRVGVNP